MTNDEVDARILNLLRQQPTSQRMLSTALGLDRQTVKLAVNRMRNTGKVHTTGHSFEALVHPGLRPGDTPEALRAKARLGPRARPRADRAIAPTAQMVLPDPIRALAAKADEHERQAKICRDTVAYWVGLTGEKS